MSSVVDCDYLVVGAGAMGMAFADALVDHADVRVALVDRRHGVGGHWLDAYPFVRLHQASTFYGVASTVLGGRRQSHGPEVGLHDRADQPTICSYYNTVADRLVATDRVELFTGCDYVGEGEFVSRVSGRRYRASSRARVVDGRYLSPDIPSQTAPLFEVEDGARVIPVNDMARLGEAPNRYVVVGSGKTATDACVWLLASGVDPDAICWVRPRDPWMLDRAQIQPDPAIYLGMVADLMREAGTATSLPDLFLRLEEAEIMIRIDRHHIPTMAKAPTLGRWELGLLRSIEDVVRLGRITRVGTDRIDLDRGSIDLPRGAVVVNCAADGLKSRPLVPIWGNEAITLQPVRAGFPCFGAALAGYIEATRDDDAIKNVLCAPSSYGNSLTDWARMNLLGTRNATAFGAEPDIKRWSDKVALNPARVPPDLADCPEVADALSRLATYAGPGLARLAQLSR